MDLPKPPERPPYLLPPAPARARLNLTLASSDELALLPDRVRLKSGYKRKATNGLGVFYVPHPDPDTSDLELDDALFQDPDRLYRISEDTWAAILRLFAHYADGHGVEVSVRLLRSEADGSLMAVLPSQIVGPASVEADLEDCINLETLAPVPSYPPEGWSPCGSVHSHVRMAPHPSGTDDKYELHDSGLHLIVGAIHLELGEMSYSVHASATNQNRRFWLPAANVLAAPVEQHPSQPLFFTGTGHAWPYSAEEASAIERYVMVEDPYSRRAGRVPASTATGVRPGMRDTYGDSKDLAGVYSNDSRYGWDYDDMGWDQRDWLDRHRGRSPSDWGTWRSTQISHCLNGLVSLAMDPSAHGPFINAFARRIGPRGHTFNMISDALTHALLNNQEPPRTTTSSEDIDDAD